MFLISHFPLVSLLHQTATCLLLSAYQLGPGPALSFLISVTIQFTYGQTQLMSSAIVVTSNGVHLWRPFRFPIDKSLTFDAEK
jgi:hypothetical protein